MQNTCKISLRIFPPARMWFGVDVVWSWAELSAKLGPKLPKNGDETPNHNPTACKINKNYNLNCGKRAHPIPAEMPHTNGRPKVCGLHNNNLFHSRVNYRDFEEKSSSNEVFLGRSRPAGAGSGCHTRGESLAAWRAHRIGSLKEGDVRHKLRLQWSNRGVRDTGRLTITPPKDAPQRG